MKIVQCIRNRMRMRVNNRSVLDEQDLVLYRQLRDTENKLHEARGLLARMQESRRNAIAECARTTRSGDGLDQQDGARQLEEFKKKIAFVESDVNRLESEYQHAQMNVRTYFYLETSPSHLSEAEVVSGQPAL